MLRPTRLAVRGFRGFAAERVVAFTSPLVLLVGENHQGKSSMLNAIEWCLYGHDAVRSTSGVRERANWEIANRFAPSVDVAVEIELADGTERYRIRRSLAAAPKRRQPQEEIRLARPDGQAVSGPEAERSIRQVLRATYRDFITATYQRQEVIRAVLTQMPGERNDAIDRLLGLTDHRNLIVAIDRARVAATQRQVMESFSAFRSEAQTAMNSGRRLLEDRRREALTRGLGDGDLTAPGAFARADAVLAALAACAAEIGVAPGERRAPRSASEIAPFLVWARSELRRLSSAIPEAKEQAAVIGRRQLMLAAQSEWVAAQTAVETARRRLADFAATRGASERIEAAIRDAHAAVEHARDAVRRANARRTLVRDALAVFDAEGVRGGAAVCPLCGQLAGDLVSHLRAEVERSTTGEIRAAETSLKQADDAAARATDVRRELAQLEATAASAETALGRVRRSGVGALGQPVDDGADLGVLLHRDLERLAADLHRLQHAASSRRQVIDRVQDDLEHLRIAADVLTLEEQRRGIERIREAPEFLSHQALRDELAGWVAHLEAVKKAIGQESNEYALRQVANAQQRIGTIFQRLTRHPAFGGMRLTVGLDATGARNVYTFAAADGRDLVPVLSQGDMNALALAVFLGLSGAGGGAGRLGFVMLDDPSQSLSTSHKRMFVEILNEVLADTMVVLSTMDAELVDMVQRLVVPAKTTLRFSDWSPRDGPRIAVEGPAA